MPAHPPAKQVLQEHEPLLTYELYDKLMAVGAKEGDSLKDTEYRDILLTIPKVSRDLLTHLMQHLRKVGGGRGRHPDTGSGSS
jgi:hypothetical protein